EGDDGLGYRITEAFESHPPATWFVLSEKGQYKVLAAPEGAPGLSQVGGEAYARVTHGDPVEAKGLVDWARSSLGPPKTLSVCRASFASVWPGPNVNPPNEFRLAVGLLWAEDGSEEAVKLLAAQRDLALTDAQELMINRAIASGN